MAVAAVVAVVVRLSGRWSESDPVARERGTAERDEDGCRSIL